MDVPINTSMKFVCSDVFLGGRKEQLPKNKLLFDGKKIRFLLNMGGLYTCGLAH